MKDSVLRVDGLSRDYTSASRTLRVLDDVSFSLDPGDVCSIVGPSGSGKTTLLGLSAGLDEPTSGKVILCGHELSRLSEDARARVRNEHVGVIFQTVQLIPTLTALENVMVPAELRGSRGARSRAQELLSEVGLEDRMTHYPKQLSGGEQQRVAIARAFINEPSILFADEPTGNLDVDTGAHIEDLLFGLNRTAGTTLVVVTHDLELAARTGRIIRLRGGRVVEDGSAHEVARLASL
jgi:putative ABC transport system ATP-binding protein